MSYQYIHQPTGDEKHDRNGKNIQDSIQSVIKENEDLKKRIEAMEAKVNAK